MAKKYISGPAPFFTFLHTSNISDSLAGFSHSVLFVTKQTATCPEVLYDEVLEVKERVILVQERSELETPDDSYGVIASTGEKVKTSSSFLNNLPFSHH